MRSTTDLKLKTYILLLLMMAFCTAGNAILDKGMKQVGSLDISSAGAIWSGLLHTLRSGTVWLGSIAGMLLFMVSQMLVLSWADYSFVMPFVALSYALVPLCGFLWLAEPVSRTRWTGIALVVLGVFLVSRTPESTTRSNLNATRVDFP